MPAIDVDALDDYTPTQLLKLVNRAIAVILVGGQSTTLLNQTFTRADLDDLRAIRAELQAEVAATSSQGRAHATFRRQR